MSNALMTLCRPLPMPPPAKAVLMALADRKNDASASVWSSISTLELDTCFGRTAVIDAIKWLEQHGALRADRTNGRHTSYSITIDAFNQSATRTSAPDGPVRVTDSTGPADGRDQSATRTGPVRQTDTNPKKPKVTQKSNPKCSARFAEFWTAYPKKAAKLDAEKAWRQKNLDALADQIIRDVTARAAGDPKWSDKAFVPLPTTYLNGERWTDEWEATAQTRARSESASEAVARVNREAEPRERVDGLRLIA